MSPTAKTPKTKPRSSTAGAAKVKAKATIAAPPKKKRSRPPPGAPPVLPPPPTSAPPAIAALTTEDHARNLRRQLQQVETEARRLAAEQETICANLLQLAQETISKAVHPDTAKATIPALKAALGNVQARQAQATMQARQIRADLTRYEATELATINPDASAHTQTLDDILKGRIPASTSERIAAARLMAATPTAKGEDDPAAALAAWTGTVWCPPTFVPGSAP